MESSEGLFETISQLKENQTATILNQHVEAFFKWKYYKFNGSFRFSKGNVCQYY